MKFARIASTAAVDALFPVLDDDISAVQREEDMAAEITYIDRLIEEVDHELVAEEHTETVRLTRDFTDQRRARRAHRRADRAVLRSLPVRMEVAELPESEAA
jgi:hypothetical protein